MKTHFRVSEEVRLRGDAIKLYPNIKPDDIGIIISSYSRHSGRWLNVKFANKIVALKHIHLQKLERANA